MTAGLFRTGMVMVTAAALAVSGCAMGSSARKVGTGDVVADRQRLMKLNGASWQDAQNKLKAGDIEAVAVNAETMAVSAQHIASLFPPGSLTEQSRAKPEIWQRWDEFVKAAETLRIQAERLRDAAKSKDAAATQAIAKEFGRQACGTCHTPFRVPPPKQS